VALGTPGGAAAGPALHRWPRIIQLQTSMLCRCCSTIWSPHSKGWSTSCGAAIRSRPSPPCGRWGSGSPGRRANRRTAPAHRQFAAMHHGDHVEVERIAAPLRAADHGQFLSSDFLAAAMKRRTCTGRCRMASRRRRVYCPRSRLRNESGRQAGGVARKTMSTPEPISFLYASKPTKRISA